MSNRVVSPGPFLITTVPSLTRCRRCSREVLAATVGGLDRHVDTACLTELGELAALMSGRATYAYVAQDYLSRRTVIDIAAGPAKRPVLADHTCQPLAAEHIDQAWSEYAKALTTALLGATVIADVIAPPF